MDCENEIYREEHGVIKELDFLNFDNPYENIKESEVKYTKYANPSGAKRMGKAKIAKGIVKTSFGLLGALSGGGWYGAHMATRGVGNIVSGATKYKYTGDIVSMVVSAIAEGEKSAWKYVQFIKQFIPAEGKIGDVVFKEGTGGDLHSGNGHVFYENGDYFEGYFQNGILKKGLYKWENGTKYLGEFDDNRLMTGMGIMVYADGTYYFGEQLSGIKNGYGYQLYKDGAYIGDWQNGFRTEGALRLENGKCFIGEFVNDQPAL